MGSGTLAIQASVKPLGFVPVPTIVRPSAEESNPEIAADIEAQIRARLLPGPVEIADEKNKPEDEVLAKEA